MTKAAGALAVKQSGGKKGGGGARANRAVANTVYADIESRLQATLLAFDSALASCRADLNNLALKHEVLACNFGTFAQQHLPIPPPPTAELPDEQDDLRAKLKAAEDKVESMETLFGDLNLCIETAHDVLRKHKLMPEFKAALAAAKAAAAADE